MGCHFMTTWSEVHVIFGLAVGDILLAFIPATSVIAFSALACILVGLSGFASPTFRSLSLPSVDSGS